MITILRLLLIWIVLINFQPAACIVNRKRNNSTTIRPQFVPRRETYKRKSYLQSNRPLWVLEDKVNLHFGEVNIPARKPVQRIRSNRRFIAPVTSSSILPNHYTNPNPDWATEPVPRSKTRRRNQKNSKSKTGFPIFDDYGMESEPILIYRGPKAKMIFNTMMSNKKYPMQEPVPGQVLYPPYSPKFQPTPVVERVRTESFPDSVFHNVTLFPFYTHEAVVDPRISESETYSFQPTNEVVENTNSIAYTESTRVEKEDCHNCYHSYYSQNDVQAKYWSLPFITPSPETTTPMSLRKSIEVPNGIYSNHRTEDTTTPIPSVIDSFRITYDNSETQNPSSLSKKQYRSVLSAKYGGFKTVYPIYTLNKLLRYKPFKNQEVKDAIEADGKKSTSAPEETWLIWNSRSRKAHKSNYLNSLSSKDLPKNHKMSRMIDHKLMIK